MTLEDLRAILGDEAYLVLRAAAAEKVQEHVNRIGASPLGQAFVRRMAPGKSPLEALVEATQDMIKEQQGR